MGISKTGRAVSIPKVFLVIFSNTCRCVYNLINNLLYAQFPALPKGLCRHFNLYIVLLNSTGTATEHRLYNDR